MNRPAVVVFARSPERGRVKTRLAKDVGLDRALDLHVWSGARGVRAVTATPRTWDVYVTFTPAGACEAVTAWLPRVDDLFAQPDGDLGARIQHAVTYTFARGHSAVVLVGTDCIAVTAERVREALGALATHDAVLGAASDGGYYLVGMNRPLDVFHDIAWSTDTVADATRARLRDVGARWAELPVETDVDTVGDLVSLRDVTDAPAWVRETLTGSGRGSSR